MTAAIRRMAAFCVLALLMSAQPAAANRAWAITEAILLDQPGGRLVGQLLTCDEVYIRDIWRNWVRVQSRRGEGWVDRFVLSNYLPGACRYTYRPPLPIRPHPPVLPPYPDRPPPPVVPPHPGWPPFPVRPPEWGERPIRPEPPYWGP